MCQKWLVLPENCHLSNWSFFSVAEDTKYAVCNSCKQKVSWGGVTTNNYCFISCLTVNDVIATSIFTAPTQVGCLDNQSVGVVACSGWEMYRSFLSVPFQTCACLHVLLLPWCALSPIRRLFLKILLCSHGTALPSQVFSSCNGSSYMYCAPPIYLH